jgi:predicted chitinase
MLRKSFIGVMVILLMLVSAPTNLIQPASAHQSEVPAGYTPVYSAEDLDKVRTNLSGKYILMNDIDLTEATGENGPFYNEGTGWVSIGTEKTPFTGILDGNDYKIIGLKQSLKSEMVVYAGLFGYVKNGKILNLGMEQSNISAENTSLDSSTSKTYAGGIVAYGYNLTITGSYNKGNIAAQSLFDGYAGGIAGYVTSQYNIFSTISNCYNTGMIQGKTSAGGIVGDAYRVQFSSVYNTADIKLPASRYTGGIVGDMSNSSVTEAYNTGEIQYQSYGGGIAGYASSSSIKNAYNEGNLNSTASSSRGGGIVGYGSAVTIGKTYNLGNITNTSQSSDGGGIAGNVYSNSSISESYNTGAITVSSYAAGIAATVHNSVISQVYNTGTLSGSISGGIVSYSSDLIIMNSFNIGGIKGKFNIGGITGWAKSGTSIKNTYNIGLLELTTSYGDKGGIAGENEGTIENSYFIDKASTGVGVGDSNGTFRVTFEQMKDISTYQGFDFSSIWNLDAGSGFLFPSLSLELTPESERNIDVSIDTLPNKLQYIQGEQLDVSGAKLSVKSNHGNTEVIDVTKDMVQGFETNMPGNQVLKVTYDGLTTTFTVSVKAKYTVTFVDYDGTVLKQEEVVEGGAATAPEVKGHEGRTFVGWDTDFSNVRNYLYVKAKYTIHSYTVTYKDGNSVLSTETYKHGDTVKTPEQPVKTGYAFMDWYKEPELQNKYSFSEPIKSNQSLYAKFVKIPAIPQNIVVKPGLDNAKVTWTPVTGADGYSVWYTTAPNEYFNGTYVSADEKEYTIWGLTPGVTYYFKVNAYQMVDGRQIDSPDSKLVSAKTVLAGVTAPKAAEAGYDKIKLTWTKSSEATGYEIYRSDSSTGTYSKIATITNNYTVSYTNSGLITGKKYFYKIRAYRTISGKNYYSSYSSSVNATPVLKGTTVKAASAGYNNVKVSWTVVSGAHGYEVYRATTKTGTYSNVKTITSGSTVSYNNTSLTTGKTYYYKVRAYRVISGKKVYSSFSSITSAVPVLAAPSKISLSKASSTAIKVYWTKVSEASGYEIYRSTQKTGTYTNIKTITSPSTINYTNTSLQKGKTYYYKVRAYKVVSGKKVYSSYTTIVSYKL